jgi:hypothetical protein
MSCAKGFALCSSPSLTFVCEAADGLEAQVVKKYAPDVLIVNLLQKLGLHSQTELIRYAFNRGILQLDK